MTSIINMHKTINFLPECVYQRIISIRENSEYYPWILLQDVLSTLTEQMIVGNVKNISYGVDKYKSSCYDGRYNCNEPSICYANKETSCPTCRPLLPVVDENTTYEPFPWSQREQCDREEEATCGINWIDHHRYQNDMQPMMESPIKYDSQEMTSN